MGPLASERRSYGARQGAGYDELLLQWHAYFAFVLLAFVALHIGVAIQDYMTDKRP